MKLPFITALLLMTVCLTWNADAQIRKSSPLRSRSQTARSVEVGQSAVVIDETLSVLRETPSLFAPGIQRMRRGRTIQIMGVADADGVKFYKVAAPPANFGWVQSDAVFGKFRPGDDERLARLVQALDGFDQVETAVEYLNLYPKSKFRPAILLLFGDLLEEIAVKLSKDANSKLVRREMAATGAPLHSYYLNFVSLDRYRKLGIQFLFNPIARQFHYDGSSWKEIASKYGSSSEVAEAKKRLELLKTKMETPPAAASPVGR